MCIWLQFKYVLDTFFLTDLLDLGKSVTSTPQHHQTIKLQVEINSEQSVFRVDDLFLCLFVLVALQPRWKLDVTTRWWGWCPVGTTLTVLPSNTGYWIKMSFPEPEKITWIISVLWSETPPPPPSPSSTIRHTLLNLHKDNRTNTRIPSKHRIDCLHRILKML